jgi:hypothetical protein
VRQHLRAPFVQQCAAQRQYQQQRDRQPEYEYLATLSPRRREIPASAATNRYPRCMPSDPARSSSTAMVPNTATRRRFRPGPKVKRQLSV